MRIKFSISIMSFCCMGVTPAKRWVNSRSSWVITDSAKNQVLSDPQKRQMYDQPLGLDIACFSLDKSEQWLLQRPGW